MNQINWDKKWKEYVLFRRDLHQYPETAFEEKRTAEKLCCQLKQLKIPYQDKIAKTGIIGTIDSGRPGKTILLRADMDALPVQEQTGLPFQSRVNGKMHACGHDVHMAVVMMAADLLNAQKSDFSGRVKILFQPAEETVGGALPMIEEGALTGVDFVAGLHVKPEIETGKIIAYSGPLMASPDDFYVTLKGKGGHCATPHQNDDLIAAGCILVQELSQLPQRFVDPVIPALLKVCTVKSGASTNAMPDEFFLQGSFRTFDKNARAILADQIEQTTRRITSLFGVSCEVSVELRYPPLVNDTRLTEALTNSAQAALGKENVITNFSPSMLGEDFSFFAQALPATYFYLGSKLPGPPLSLHSPTFQVDEACIQVGAKVLFHFVMDMLK